MHDMMLIVDDVEMNREILKAIFANKYEILEAENGEEALSMVSACQGSIDIILLDLVMEGMSGFDILERRKGIAYFQKIPVVVITSSSHSEDQVHAFDLGANEYITKPFIPEIVLSRINNIMASNHRMQSMELEAEKMKIKSEVDEMTNLYNKTTTECMMDSILVESNGCQEVMMIVDIDNFKTVNDTLGHQTGDHVIKVIADLLSGVFRKTDIIGRIGGDEFCVLMVDIPKMDIAYAKANELIQIMRYKRKLSVPEYVTLSIGIASNKQQNTSYAKLFSKADQALYEAKQGGKAQFREYGVKPVKMKSDERPIVISISNNRSVSSMLYALVPNYMRIVEVSKIEDLIRIDPSEREKIRIYYVDVSDKTEEEQEKLWEQIEKTDWVNRNNIFAICEEGNLSQYMSVLKQGVADMITTPIDQEVFKRRTLRKLEEFIQC